MEPTPDDHDKKFQIFRLLRTEHLNLEENFQIEKLCNLLAHIYHLENTNLLFTNQIHNTDTNLYINRKSNDK